MKINFKTVLPHLISILAFVIVSSIYFSPLFEGYTLKQGDVRQYKGMSKEIEDYRVTHGKEALWTNSMFGGMPAYQISVDYTNNFLGKVNQFMQLSLPRPVGLLFVTMLGFYIFGLCLKINPWLSMIGGLAFGLSTINILYIGAGHITKVNSIAYMAPALGGLLVAFRGNKLLGAAIFGLFFSLNLTCNHFQMTYYLIILLVAVALAEVLRLILIKQFVSIGKSIAFLVIASVIAILPVLGNILSTLEYSKYTTRGTTDLTIKPKGQEAEVRTTEGLNTDYILEYNYGKGEILSLIAPNAKGAKDDLIGNDEEAIENVDGQFREQISQMNHYWGGQRMSGGAFYFGVVMFVFFIFGLVFVKDSIKWPFLVVTILALLLASKDPGGINNFFINKVPMYNKFRDSKMILVLIQIMIPALAILFLDKLMTKKEEILQKKPLLITSGALLLFGFILYASPSISGNFLRADEINQFDEVVKTVKDPAQVVMYNDMKQALIETRISIYQSEIGRTIMLLIVGCGLVLLAFYTKINRIVLTVIVLVFVFGDNLSVCRRYLNSEENGTKYISYDEEGMSTMIYAPFQADLSILNREKSSISNFETKKSQLVSKMRESKQYGSIESNSVLESLADFGTLNLNTDYRVLTFAGTFNETNTSYFHKSVGGYHGAKLKRYQELIDFYIGNEMQDLNKVLSEVKNAKLQEYAKLLPISQDQAQAVFDTISVEELALPESSPVLNMLNVKYLILDPSKDAIANDAANGNAWFVNEIISAANSNEEMSKLKSLNSKSQAIVNKEFKGVTASKSLDSNATISLVKYDVNELSYRSKSNVKAPAIFSEIWYPEGWNCYIDGKKSDVFRANYILRGTLIPAGEHTIVWKFEPDTYFKSESIALLGSISLIGGCILIFGMSLRPKKEEETKEVA